MNSLMSEDDLCALDAVVVIGQPGVSRISTSRLASAYLICIIVARKQTCGTPF